MIREIIKEAKNLTATVEITGTSPAGSWNVILGDENKVVGGTDPWNQPITKEWVMGLVDKGKEKEFMKAVEKQDLKRANNLFAMDATITGINGSFRKLK